MRHFLFLISYFVLAFTQIFAQDTFSIVCADSATREVGSAGASCLDLIAFGIQDASFLGQLFPDTGAVNTQAMYNPQNQQRVAERMKTNDTPEQIATWVYENDVEDNPDIRQYGFVKFMGASAQSAGFTGQSCIDYKNHVTGVIDGIAYAIQGNILSGQHVLDSMEAGFKRAKGTLACRMMEAMQGANSIGADTRCEPNGTSSLFAFLKVAKPTDKADKPYITLSVLTSNGEREEPINELQRQFDLSYACSTVNVKEEINTAFYPNPANGFINFSNPQSDIQLYDAKGKLIMNLKGPLQSIDCSGLANGVYSMHTQTLKGSVIIHK
ncbi:MAG: DUF1028 domain-containing protein [Ignavibacteria bacterium]